MDTGSDRVAEPWEVSEGQSDDFVFEGFERFEPLACLWVVPCMQFGYESQEPSPSVHAFEGAVFFDLKVGGFRVDVFLGQALVEAFSRSLGQGMHGIGFEQTDQGPVSVDAAVPIEATVEGWVEFFRAKDIGWSDEYVRGFVGVLAMDSIESEFRDRCGLGIEDSRRGILGCPA